jgi:hypothetical protein
VEMIGVKSRLHSPTSPDRNPAPIEVSNPTIPILGLAPNFFIISLTLL